MSTVQSKVFAGGSPAIQASEAAALLTLRGLGHYCGHAGAVVLLGGGPGFVFSPSNWVVDPATGHSRPRGLCRAEVGVVASEANDDYPPFGLEHPGYLTGVVILLQADGIGSTMSGVGNYYDKAVAESFFGLLKRERVHQWQYRTQAEARTNIYDYLERFYTHHRSPSFYLGAVPRSFVEQHHQKFSSTCR
ncbi:MAG: IS3 family transposase [Nitrospirales bacterium]